MKVGMRNWLSVLKIAASGLLCFALVVVIVYTTYSAQLSLYRLEAFRVRTIHFQGLARTDPIQLRELIRGTLPENENILRISLDYLLQLVESEPWVKNALVRRKLPGQLLIHLVERLPLAIATIEGELYVVDSEGVVVDRYGSRYQDIDRPIVQGLQNTARTDAQNENSRRMQTYLHLLEEFVSPLDYTLLVSEIDVGNPGRVSIIPTDEPVRIYLGSESFRKRFQTFLEKKELYYQIKKQYGSIDYVDVSYENKIIFHTPEGIQETSSKPEDLVSERGIALWMILFNWQASSLRRSCEKNALSLA